MAALNIAVVLQFWRFLFSADTKFVIAKYRDSCQQSVNTLVWRQPKAAEGGSGWGTKPQGVWGTRVPQRGPGADPRYGVWGTKSPRSWRIFKVVTSKFYAFLVVFHTFSTYICLCFSMLAGIIPQSLRNGGHVIPFAPLVCKWGAIARPPAPLPMTSTWSHKIRREIKAVDVVDI